MKDQEQIEIMCEDGETYIDVNNFNEIVGIKMYCKARDLRKCNL